MDAVIDCSIEVSSDLNTGGLCIRPPKWVDANGRAVCEYHAAFVKESRKTTWEAL